MLHCADWTPGTGDATAEIKRLSSANVASAKPSKTLARYVRYSAMSVGPLTLKLRSRCPSQTWRTPCTRDGVLRSLNYRLHRTTPTLSCAAAAKHRSTVRSHTEAWSMQHTTDQRLCLRHRNNKCFRQAVMSTSTRLSRLFQGYITQSWVIDNTNSYSN